MIKKLLIDGSTIIGEQPAHPDAIEVECPDHFDDSEHPLPGWRYDGSGGVYYDETFGNIRLIEHTKEVLQQYLNQTDWYIIRKMERGVDVPSDVQKKRLDAIGYLDTH